MQVKVNIELIGDAHDVFPRLARLVGESRIIDENILTVNEPPPAVKIGKAKREAESEEDSVISIGDLKQPKKRGRPATKKKQEQPEEELEEAEDDDEEEEVDEAEEEAEDDEEPEEEEEEEKPKRGRKKKDDKKSNVLSIEDHVRPAVKAFAEKYGMAAANKVLKKFNVKSILDLDPAQYPKFMQAVRV